MRIPLSERRGASKPYWVFFGYGGKYSGRYAVVESTNVERAQSKAVERWGNSEVKGVECNKDRAKEKIAASGFTPLDSILEA